jgi:hypothetical protein
MSQPMGGKKMAITAEQAKAKAIELVAKYPSASNVQELMDLAIINNEFSTKNESVAVWGRVCRLLPQKVGA